MSGTDGLILAGGRGRRLGLGPKHAVALAGRPMHAHCAAWLRPQVDRLMLNAADSTIADGTVRVPDAEFAGQGPLAGVLAGLTACDADWLAVMPVDAVRAPADLVTRLRAAAGTGRAAHVDGHFCCLLVSATARDGLSRYLSAGHRRVAGWLQAMDSVPLAVDGGEAIWSINTPDELRLAGSQLGVP